jgi:hypothetical protein
MLKIIENYIKYCQNYVKIIEITLKLSDALKYICYTYLKYRKTGYHSKHPKTFPP